MEGALAYDSYMHTGQAERLLKERFYQQFEEEFLTPDGNVVPIRSAISMSSGMK